MTLGVFHAAAESALTPVAVPHVAWSPCSFPVAFSWVAGGFSFAVPIPLFSSCLAVCTCSQFRIQ